MEEDIKKSPGGIKKWRGDPLHQLIPSGALGVMPPTKMQLNRIYKIKQRADSKSMLVLMEKPCLA